MPPKEKAEAQTFTFQEVACMIAAMNAGGVTLGAKYYNLMAKLDGERTASGFEHKFRAVKARGKELAGELADGTPAPPKTPKSRMKTAATSTSKKRGKKDADHEDDDDALVTPSKKTTVKKEPSEDTCDNGADGYHINRGYFENAMGQQ